MSTVPTPEQAAIINAAANTPNHLLIEARAGTGKTWSLLRVVPTLAGSTIIMAFNKSIAKELETRTADLPFAARLSLEIGTVHAIGLRTYTANTGRKPRINGGKVNFIQKDLFSANTRDRDYFSKAGYLLTQMVSGAKSSGFGITDSVESFPAIDDEAAWYTLIEHHNWDIELEKAGIDLARAITHAQKLLTISNNQREIIDFDDMIYLPLLLQHKTKTFNNVLIDEAQDISPTRRELAFRLLDGNGRMIAVGDEFQAIYGFTGADASSLLNIGKRCERLGPLTKLPLTVCWRCDLNIIAEAQKQVPDIRAKPNAFPGHVASIPYPSLVEGLAGNLPAEKMEHVVELLPKPGDAILCRLNRPNVSMALALIRAGVRARIEGKDIGKKLLSYCKQANPLYAHHDLHETLTLLEEWGEDQIRQLASHERHTQASLLEDEVAAAVVLIERCLEQGRTDFGDLEWLVADLFDDDIPPAGVVTLSSIHKSKGREWGRVYILGRFDYMPFHRATQPWEKQQESNLIYVAATRAENSLVYITEVQSTLDKRG